MFKKTLTTVTIIAAFIGLLPAAASASSDRPANELMMDASTMELMSTDASTMELMSSDMGTSEFRTHRAIGFGSWTTTTGT